MSTQEVKKAKRRKNKAAAKYTGPTMTMTIPHTNEVFEVNEDSADAERIARLMDAPDDESSMLHFNRGPNPYLDKEKCLLCGADRSEPLTSGTDGSGEDQRTDGDGHAFEQIPVWVCQSCRHTTDGDINRKLDMSGVAEIPLPTVGLSSEQDLNLDSNTLSMLGDFSFPSTGEPLLVNGSICNCDSCMERRQITQEAEQETKALQDTYSALRATVRKLYSMEISSLNEEEASIFREQVDKLCCRDPHQLFQRLESQVREFVIETKVNLRKTITEGYTTPPKAKDIMSMLLDEYYNLSNVARSVSENLSTLKDHLRRFNVTWELHNKHLYHSIVYSEPAIQGCLEALCEQLRNGALDKDSYTEDTYPTLMKRFIGFRNEMSVILVLWHDCQQLIDRYNEEQTALRVKQKWLKEDWEFFKQQRKILEQQVLKNNPAALPHSMEAQFTETMRNMLSGQKPVVEESHCPRCSRKRCPCDECTITHMITCGIINPEQLEANTAHHTFNFPHDANRYIIDVTPPSMSSTTSSSASTSPVPVCREMPVHHLNPCSIAVVDSPPPDDGSVRMDEGGYNEDFDAEADNDTEEREDDEEDEEEDDEDDDDDDDNDADDDEEEEDDDDREDEEDEGDADEEDDDDEDERIISQDQKDFDDMLASGKLGLPTSPVVVPMAESWKLLGAMCQQHLALGAQQVEESLELSGQEFPSMPPPSTCACHHCVNTAQQESAQQVGTEEMQCQCHICLQQRGQTVSTALPTSLPLPPRPAQLHLYPHIHGTLPPAAHSHLHMPHTTHTPAQTLHLQNLLSPQLYNLHGPRFTPFPVTLGLDESESFHDPLLNAYDDWENTPTVDPSRLFGAAHHRFPGTVTSDLLPPPPLPMDTPLTFESLATVVSGSHSLAACHSLLVPSGLSVANNGTSAFKTVATGFSNGIPPAFQVPLDPSLMQRDMSFASSQSCALAASSSAASSYSNPSVSAAAPQLTVGVRQELNLNFATPLSLSSLSFSAGTPASLSLPLTHNPPPPPPCTRPAPLGGNAGASSPVPASKEQRTYAQPCKKYTSGAGRQAAAGSAGVASSSPQPVNQSHSNLSMPNFNIGSLQAGNSASKVPAKMQQQQRQANGDSLHTCAHSHAVHNGGGEGHADLHVGMNSCTASSAASGLLNNVSVGTSTLCQDPDCHSHHDDNCDSIDDSCSEKSSSTSASTNQKEGKYCDCCYCEFFGHGNTQVSQTSKNFAEMRERLRRRLKQRNEAKQDRGGDHNPQMDSQHSQPLNMKNLDELLNFINGTDSDGTKADHHQSSRAAKRARQKQRKAEERLRQEEAERRQKLAAQQKEEEEKTSASARSSGQRKKSKHKDEQHHKTASSFSNCCSSTGTCAPTPPTSKPDTALRETPNKTKGKQKGEEKWDGSAQQGDRDEDSPLQSQQPPVTGESAKPAGSQSALTSAVTVIKEVSAPSVSMMITAPPSLLTKASLKSAEVFQPPAHLLRSLAEQTMQQQMVANTATSSATTTTTTVTTSIFNTSPNALPTLGGQPNSPTAKKAKRRLGPAGSASQLTAHRKLLLQAPLNGEGPQLPAGEIQRRMEAQQDVAKQMKEAHDYALHQSQLRNLQQHSEVLPQQAQVQQPVESQKPSTRPVAQKPAQQSPLPVQTDFPQMFKMQQLKQQQQQLQQQQLRQQRTANQKQTPVSRQPPVGKQQQISAPPPPPQQQMKATVNGVPGLHGGNNNFNKVANGDAKTGLHAGEVVSSAPVSWHQPALGKLQPQGINGLSTVSLHQRLMDMPLRVSSNQQESGEMGTKNTRSRNKKKKKASQDLRAVDEVFLPRPEAELESNDMDEADRDIEKFKRFVMEAPTPPKERKKLDITLNMKDIFNKKKSGLGCA